MHRVYAKPGTQIQLRDCGRPFSFFFDMIAPLWHGHNVNPMHRICSLMRKMGVRSVICEPLDDFPELLEEVAAASVRTGGTVTGEARRISFFRTTATTDWHHALEGDLLGYAVVLSLNLPNGTERTYILEAVLRIPTMWLPDSGTSPVASTVTNYYVHCCRRFVTTIGTSGDSRDFSFLGTFFCQQNRLTHVCAHAALRTAINSSADFDTSQVGKLTNKTINEHLGIDHRKNRVGQYDSEATGSEKGLDASQITSVGQKSGFDVQFADFSKYPAVAYGDLIYPLIESGFPTVLGIWAGNEGHAMAVLGHTTNSDRWTPEARKGYNVPPITEYISTSAWTDHYIVADDNFGMYVTLPSDALRPVPSPLVPGAVLVPGLYALLAIGFVPKGVSTTGYETEQTTSYVARALADLLPADGIRWLQTLKNSLKSSTHPMVCRTLLQKRDAYLKATMHAEDADGGRLGQSEEALISCLPDRFWVTEVTIPNLLAGNKRKLGDILASRQPAESGNQLDEVMFAWLPGFAWAAPGYPTKSPGSDIVRRWPFQSHVPILRGSGEDRPLLEW